MQLNIQMALANNKALVLPSPSLPFLVPSFFLSMSLLDYGE